MAAQERAEYDYVDYRSQGNEWQGKAANRIKLTAMQLEVICLFPCSKSAPNFECCLQIFRKLFFVDFSLMIFIKDTCMEFSII